MKSSSKRYQCEVSQQLNIFGHLVRVCAARANVIDSGRMCAEFISCAITRTPSVESYQIVLR